MTPKCGTCVYCYKFVHDKPVLGTLHVCLSEWERELVDAQRKLLLAQGESIRQLQEDAADGVSPIARLMGRR